MYDILRMVIFVVEAYEWQASGTIIFDGLPILDYKDANANWILSMREKFV